MSIQRFLSTRDAAAARRTLLVAQVTDVAVASLLALTGVALLGYYRTHSQLLAEGQTITTAGDQLFPRFIMTQMPMGLAGLDRGRDTFGRDVELVVGRQFDMRRGGPRFLIARRCGRVERGAANVVRLKRLTWFVAFGAIGLSILNTLIEGNLVERCFKIVNLLTAPLFVLFFLALFVPWANAVGAWLGLAAAIVTAVAIAYAPDLGLNLRVSFVWMMPCSLLAGVTVGTLASALARPGLPGVPND